MEVYLSRTCSPFGVTPGAPGESPPGKYGLSAGFTAIEEAG